VEELDNSKKTEDFLIKEEEKTDEIVKSHSHLEKKGKEEANEKKEEEKKSIKKDAKKLKKAEKVKDIEKEEELSIDFSKIKNFFTSKFTSKKPKLKPEKNERKSAEEISLNISSVLNFINDYKVVILILIAMFFAVFIRMQSMNLSFTDKWADTTVDNYYKQQIKAQIDKQYPNLPDANKQTLLEQQFSSYKSQNAKLFEQQKKELSEQFKNFYRFDSDGKNYMPDIDPYAFLRYAENYLKNGYIGDIKKVINGTEVQIDNHQLGPLGNVIETKTLHPYLLAYLHYIVKIFDPSTTPMNSASYFPVIFAALSVIPAFFIGKKIAGNVGGFFSALIVAINPSFMGRSLWGHADTDAYNIFFPLFIVWVFLVAIEQKDRVRQFSYAATAGLITGLYALAWNGWWYVFDFIIGMLVIYLIYLLATEGFKENSKKTLAIAGVFILSSAIFVSLFSAGGFTSFINAPLNPISFSKLKIAAHTTLWPNVYTTVAELNPASISQIVGSVGGGLLFFLSIVGIVLMFFKKDEKLMIPAAVLVVLWYIGIFYASTKGVRFTMMLVPPFALAFGAFAGRVYNGITNYAEKDMKLSKKVTGPIIVIILLLIMINQYSASVNAAKNDVPIINDAWFNALDAIKMKSAPNAIVNSWWDFGYHFEYYTDRAVTFDGGSQNTPMAHWIGKVLLTDDEDLATGILRMLDCGENTAFDKLNEKINDVSVSVRMLYDIVKLNKSEAKEYLLKSGLSEAEAENVLTYTHCTPPEDYFITSEDMVGKSGVWAHFGSWDFDRADIWVYARNLSQEQAVGFIMKNSNVSKKEAEKLYFEVQGITDEEEANTWIAPWPSYAGTSSCVNFANETIRCNNGVVINLTTIDVFAQTQQGIMHPDSFVYKTYNGIAEKKFNSSLGLSIALLDVQKPSIVVMQPQLARSMFTRLYYYEGYGLKHFELFSHQQGITGTNVYVWKINWEGKSKNV